MPANALGPASVYRHIRAAALILFAACGGAPQFPHASPVALPPAAPPAAVRLEARPLSWWTPAGTADQFILQLPAPERTTPGRDLGAIRSGDLELDEHSFATLRCAWKIVTMGDRRPCDGSREDAMAEIHDQLRLVLDDLRARASAAGADLAADVRCFASVHRTWCEGVARVTGGGPDVDPVAPIANPPIARTHFILVADGSVAIQGEPTIGSSVGFRFRPLEATFDVLSMPATGLVGLGGGGLARIPLGSSGFDAIVGGSAAGVAPNGAVNPHFKLDATGFVGVAYQSKWRWLGAAQPWFQFRLGATRYDAQTTPLVALHIGLSTPDR